MRAELKRLHSPDADPLQSYQPADPRCFGIFVQAMIGPAGGDGEESFDFMLCTPLWLASRTQAITLGEHHVIVLEYDYVALEAFVRAFCTNCEGETWDDVARRVSSLGRWEFADYAT
jgi:hypothetical protein